MKNVLLLLILFLLVNISLSESRIENKREIAQQSERQQ